MACDQHGSPASHRVFVPHPPPCDGSRSWSSCCLFLLPTDPSGWLPHLTLSWFLDLTALLTHLVTSDPSTWLSSPS
ncbi:hypothetical protein F7725_017023 [Dissostichus mawsoni]|uniref:Uncharacterized protein n=1 Tax=Dissostichus mawsoni TaxID=36200 RepID=A0A7J5Z3X4_DISMA|nr:hypothetical protein F7725_017023 [Dissostichus mawsoni]